MNRKESWWIVTDLDGTLMDHNYDITPAIETLSWLKQAKIPVIPCTSKTAAEVEVFRNEFGLIDPYIVENGGAVYGGSNHLSGCWELVLGQRYEDLRPLLDQLSEAIGYPLRAFKELSNTEIEALTGLKGEAIKLACKRLWSVPFLNPPSNDFKRLDLIAESLNTTIFQGNRMSHLLG